MNSACYASEYFLIPIFSEKEEERECDPKAKSLANLLPDHDITTEKVRKSIISK